MKPLQRWTLLTGTILTGLTGLIYAWMKYLLVPETEWAVINHPLQPWVLKAHLLTAPILVFGIGATFFDHILKHIRSGIEPGRRTGVLLTWVLLPMVLSGYLIQSVTHLGWLRAMVWAHVGTSLAYLAFYAAHARLMAIRRGQRGASVRLRRARRRRGPAGEGGELGRSASAPEGTPSAIADRSAATTRADGTLAPRDGGSAGVGGRAELAMVAPGRFAENPLP